MAERTNRYYNSVLGIDFCFLYIYTVQWQIIKVEGGWNIRNVASGLFLQLDGHARDNTNVVATSVPFVWHIWDDEEDRSTTR